MRESSDRRLWVVCRLGTPMSPPTPAASGLDLSLSRDDGDAMGLLTHPLAIGAESGVCPRLYARSPSVLLPWATLAPWAPAPRPWPTSMAPSPESECQQRWRRSTGGREVAPPGPSLIPPGSLAPRSYGFDPLGLLDPANSGGFVNPEWLRYSEVSGASRL
jgi:hypothetical protein